MSAEVLERPLQDSPEEMRRIREETKEILYSDVVRERYGKELPKTSQELQEGWDHLIDVAAAEREENREKEAKKVPNIVLRDLLEDDRRWTEELGWPKEDRDRVKEELANVLKLDENGVKNAFECIVASGRTPQEVLAMLTPEAFQQQKDEIARTYTQYQLDEADIDLAARALFLEDVLEGLDPQMKIMYVKRFILAKEFDNRSLRFLGDHGGVGHLGYGVSLSDEFYNKLPEDNMFDIAWNIAYERKNGEDVYGLNAQFPILRMQVRSKQEGEDGRVHGRYVVDQAHFMEWMREQMWRWYEEIDTDEVTDYFNKIDIRKGQYYSVNLINLIFNKKYFYDETGHHWGELWNQVLFEPWMMYFMRTYFIKYEHVQASEENLAKMFDEDFYLSKATRKLQNSSMIGKWAMMALNYEGRDSDTKLGEAFQEMFMVYYFMADYEMLSKMIGENSQFFTREFWIDAIMKVAEEDVDATGMPKISRYLGGKIDAFDKAFKDKNGNVTERVSDKKAFIEWLNYFNGPVQSSTWVEIIDDGIRKLVEDKFVYEDKQDLDEHGKPKKKVKKYDLLYAWFMAHTWKNFTGAAALNNAPSYSGHLAQTKWTYPRYYGDKYVGYAGGGNPFFVGMIRSLGLPMLEGLALEDSYEEYVVSYDKNGKPIYGKPREMNPLEVLIKMRLLTQTYDTQIKEKKSAFESSTDADERNRLMREISRLEEEKTLKYKMAGGKLVFKEDAMRNYAQNQIGRTKVLFEQFLGADEINFEEFIRYDGIFAGADFERAKWQKALQGRLVTPLRYLFEANGATQMNALRRFPDENGNWQEMYVAESMMGHQVLDVPEFRMQVSDLDKEEWAARKKLGFRKRGKYVLRPDGEHEINYNKVQANKRRAWKEWMLTKLFADLHQHVSMHSTDPKFSMSHFMKIRRSIEDLPGKLLADEFHMKDARITEAFFNKKWIRQRLIESGLTTTKLFNREFWASVFGGKYKKESLLGESGSTFISSIFKGYH